MVNTRRKETNESSEVLLHRTRRNLRPIIKQEPSSSVESDRDDTDDELKTEETGDNNNKRQLRSTYRDFPNKSFPPRPIRTDHKRLSLNETLSLYSRKMHDDSDSDPVENVYSIRSRRSRHLIRMNRLQKRTALSLRPISQKCYADSPLQFNSDSEHRVRRSNRKRANISWLDDNQMHKVGYPNLNGYSEEDSRDNNLDITSRRITRREIKTPKYLFDYGIGPNRRQRNKEDKTEDATKVDNENPEQTTEVNKSNEKNNEKCTEKNTEENSNENDKEKEKDTSSNSDDDDDEEEEEVPLSRLRPNPRSRNQKFLLERSLRTVRKQNVGIDTSSESEEEEKKYLLRDRRPKQAPTAMQQSVLKTRVLRTRRFTRHRQDSSSSTDSSSSDVRHSKPPKSPHHAKNEKLRTGGGGIMKMAPIKPETLDSSIRFGSIGGLDSHIKCLIEMILLPMTYPEVFSQFHIKPPKGVLFHGPPGTGKTLLARALANECNYRKQKVSFFLRKGADLLSKWIGESEKQLRQLFEQAAEMKPSIIFFDELDGLAPVRSSRQDQVHASIVSTLLALMDGLTDRGDVIVIGATNRIDSIDPALRRPGRFDRELYFPLPSSKERSAILNVHTSNWSNRPNNQLLDYLSENTTGYCGSDLRALCSEAVIQSFRRTYPQVYNSEHKLMIQPENVRVEKVDFLLAKSVLVPAAHRITQGLARKLAPIFEPLLMEPLEECFELIKSSFPHGTSTALAKVKLSPNLRPAQLLITGNGPEHGQTSHLAPAILHKMEHIQSYTLNLTELHQDSNRSPEETCIQIFKEAKKTVPSIIFVPDINKWWILVSETVRELFKSLLMNFESNIPLLLLATSDDLHQNLPIELQRLFSHYRKEVFEMGTSSSEQRLEFFKPLIIDASLKPVRCKRKLPKVEPLPRLPTPPPPPLTEEQLKRLYEDEEHTLRELRIFLRDMCKKLGNNKLFFMFTKPVDTEEVPDYPNIIKEPMDLETMMTKVDFHRYECARDFLKDIELICQNALEYNPAKTSADKQIRHRACSLRDYAYTLIKTEMDTDFETKCQEISRKRRERKHCHTKYLPPYIYTPEAEKEGVERNSEENGEKNIKTSRRKRKISKWQRGLATATKRKKTVENGNENITETPKKEDFRDNRKVDESSSSIQPLSINCDIGNSNHNERSLQSPQRRLSDLLSPSELLENPLDFDDVDEALNETVSEKPVAVECSPDELLQVLDTTVRLSQNLPFLSLQDLYNELNGVISRFAKTHERKDLPKELAKELARFKKEAILSDYSKNS